MNVSPETVADAVRGDGPAVRRIVDTLQAPLYNLALRMLGAHAAAEDATQEALLRIVTHLGTFRSESRFSTWAWTLAVRTVRDVQRRERRQPLSIEDFAQDLATDRDDAGSETAENAVLLGRSSSGAAGRWLLRPPRRAPRDPGAARSRGPRHGGVSSPARWMTP